MTAAVACDVSTTVQQTVDTSAVARKRRREIILSHRSGAPDPVPSTDAEDVLPPKKRKVSVSEESVPTEIAVAETDSIKLGNKAKAANAKKAKKPQMKYDPDVPMTKEETAAWRREQRRKRNRESAAASRQKQRDRIAELEVEVDGWKAKFEEAMKRIRQLEAGANQNVVSPCASPNLCPNPSPTSLLLVASSIVDTRRDSEGASTEPKIKEETEKQHLIETISRPA